jgi:hypothetical protein
MGLDFLRRVAPAFHRALDRRAVELRTPTLFVRDIPELARTASADICRNAKVETGEKLLLRLMDEKLIAQRDNLVVAEFSNPPSEFVNRIRTGAGVEIGEVRTVHSLSQVVEIGFCQ